MKFVPSGTLPWTNLGCDTKKSKWYYQQRASLHYHKAAISACQPFPNAVRSEPVASDMLLGERRGLSAMNVKATWSFSADWHVFKLRCNPGGISWVNHGIKLKTIIDLCICWPKTPREITRRRELMMDRLAPSHRLHARWGLNSIEVRFVCLKSKNV